METSAIALVATNQRSFAKPEKRAGKPCEPIRRSTRAEKNCMDEARAEEQRREEARAEEQRREEAYRVRVHFLMSKEQRREARAVKQRGEEARAKEKRREEARAEEQRREARGSRQPPRSRQPPPFLLAFQVQGFTNFKVPSKTKAPKKKTVKAKPAPRKATVVPVPRCERGASGCERATGGRGAQASDVDQG